MLTVINTNVEFEALINDIAKAWGYESAVIVRAAMPVIAGMVENGNAVGKKAAATMLLEMYNNWTNGVNVDEDLAWVASLVAVNA